MNPSIPKRWDVLGVGSSAVDEMLLIDHFPQRDEKMAVVSMQRMAGGQTATALVAAARHGAQAAFCGRLGEDELSAFTARELEAEGVNCSTVRYAPGSRPFHAVVLVEQGSGRRTILYSTENVFEPEIASIPTEWIDQSRVVFTDQNNPRSGLWAATEARRRGIPIVADIEKTTAPELDELVAVVDHLIVSTSFAHWYTGKDTISAMLQALARDDRAALIITAGEQGCWVLAGSQSEEHIPAHPVQVVDTTGCGDVFHGAYAAAIARGEQIRRAAQVATVTAGLKACRAGGRAGIPTLQVVEGVLAFPSPK